MKSISSASALTFTLPRNRAQRRVPALAKRGLMSRFWRATAYVALFGMLQATLPPLHQLVAQPFRSFEEHSKDDVDRFVDRAGRLSDVDSWSNYVVTGIAQERVQWEEESYAALRKELLADGEGAEPEEQEAIEANLQAQFETALVAWETEATEYFLNERGSYRGERAAIDVELAAEEDYEALIASVEAQTAADLELDLASWDAHISVGNAALVGNFETELTADLDVARAGFAGDATERAAFEAQLDERAAELRQEFEFRDRFYLLRARNDYVARIRSDDVSARVLADSQSADAIAGQVMAETSAELGARTDDMLAAARDQIRNLGTDGAPGPESIGDLAGDWEAQVENVISAGLRRWDQAREELYREQLLWQTEAEASRAAGEKVWAANHKKLEAAREEWLQEVREQIDVGRTIWEEKFTEFAAGRTQAEEQLEQFIAEERARRTASMDRLGEMVRGGGGALLEAKEAYYYYEGLLAELSPEGANCNSGKPDDELYCFYRDQRDLTQNSIRQFQAILGASEVALSDQMHADGGYTGFLNDRRAFAGTLAADIAGLDAAEFENKLREHMETRSEDYVLYQRDMESLQQGNAIFTTRARQLEQDGGFDFATVTDIESLRALVGGLGLKYDEHRLELSAIIDQDRTSLAAADRLPAIKTDIEAWIARSQNRDARLRETVISYFDDGQVGYYLTANENDPYLMTQAEVEWERLRRERNYLAKRFQTAEAVKRYADLAANHEAGLEIAQVTAERAEVAEIRRDLRELYYMLLKGDLELDPLVASNDSVRDSEFARLLSERGIDRTELFAYEVRLNQETDMLADLISIDSPDSGDVSDTINEIDTFLNGIESVEQRERHRMSATRAKLLILRQEIDGGQSAEVIANRWITIRAGLNALHNELTNLATDYDFVGFRTELTALETGLSDATLVDRREALYLKREEIQLNAAELAVARARLGEAQTAYSRARKDFQILQSGNSAAIIRENMLEATQELAGVLNRMSVIEELPGFETDRPHDLVGVEQADYLRAVSDRRAADTELARSSVLLSHVRGLELAKARRAALESILAAAGDLSALTPDDLADRFLDAETDLITRIAGTPESQSFGRTTMVIDELRFTRDSYRTARDAFDVAVAAGADPAELEVLRAGMTREAEQIRTLAGQLITNVIGEEDVRTQTVRGLLDPSAIRPADEIAAEQESAMVEINERALDLARAAADDIVSFLESRREQSFAQLLAAANDLVDAAGDSPRTDGGALALSVEAGRAMMRAAILREWLLGKRGAIEDALVPPSAADAPTVAEKWDELLQFARNDAGDSAFYESFAADMPADATDQWVVDFRDERSALLAQLDAVLAAPDGAALVAAYAGLDLSARTSLARYLPVSATALRADLKTLRATIDTDLTSLSSNFRAIYLREINYDSNREKNRISRAFAQQAALLQSLEGELETLIADVARLDGEIAAAIDPALLAQLTEQRTAVQTRVDDLELRVTPLTDEVNQLGIEYRENMNRLNAIQQPLSSAPLAAMARAHVSEELEGVQLLGRLRETPRMADVALRDPSSEELTDRLKAIVGFYETDPTGAIVRDGDTPRVSAEFQSLGMTDPAADIQAILAGNQRGDDLARWSTRLIAWMEDPANSAESEPEIFASVNLLADAVQSYHIAVAYIENRDSDAESIETQAELRKSDTLAMAAKLRRLQTFEAQLREAVARAELVPNGDPMSAALAVLEAPDNLSVFHLFRGMNLDGEPDGLEDPELQARADRLYRMGQALRESRRNAYLLSMADLYAQVLEDYMAVAQTVADPLLVPVLDQTAFIEQIAELDSEAARTAIEGIAVDQDFRSNLGAWLAAAPAQSALFSDAVRDVLTETVANGAELRTAVLDRIAQLDSELNSTITFYLDEMDFVALRDARVRVDDTVANALAAALVQEGLAPAELARLELDLYERELKRALGVAATSDRYQAADYPDGLSEFMLVHGFTQARERYAAYQQERASDVASRREGATLNLSYLTGDFARYILALDFEDYRQANPDQSIQAFVDAARMNGDAVFLGGYLQRYLVDQNLNPALLPENGALLVERAARHEYARLHGDGIAAGGLQNLDESRYLADFADYVQVAMLVDFADRNAFTLSGATPAERRTNYRAHFEEALDDAAYVRDGSSLRVRLLAGQSIDRLFELAFLNIEGNADLTDFLPTVLAGVDPLAPVSDPEQELPAELLAMPDYTSLESRAILAAVQPGYLQALAIMESTARLRSGDVDGFLSASDAQLDEILERAGYSGATALDAATRSAVHTALQERLTVGYFASAGAAGASDALSVLRSDRAAQVLAGDADGLREMHTLLASGTIERLEARTEAAIAGASPDLREQLTNRRNAVTRALVESLYVERGDVAGYSGATTTLFTQVPELQAMLASISSQMSTDFAGVVARDRALVERYLSVVQESDADRSFLENLFSDPSFKDSEVTRLDLRFEFQRALALNERESVLRSTALFATLEDGQSLQRSRSREWAQDLAEAEALLQFADLRGESDKPAENRFVNYRTYVGSEAAYQAADYEKYLETEPDPEKTSEEFHNARVLKGASLDRDPQDLLNQTRDAWQDVLRSDDPAAAASSVDLDDDGDASNDPQIVVIRSVSTEARRSAAGDSAGQMEFLFQENLANHYLEAVSRLNSAFTTVFQSAAVAGGRGETGSREEFRTLVEAAYDVDAAAGANDLAALETIVQNATDRSTQLDDRVLQQKRDRVTGALAHVSQISQEFADSARRKHIAQIGATEFIETVYTAVADEIAAAETELAAVTLAGDNLQNEYEAANITYVTDLNQLADRFQKYSVASDEFERRQAIREFAETPYLFASVDRQTATDDQQATDGFSADAREEYDLARAALGAAETRLKEAAFTVRTEARLADLQEIIAGVDNGETYEPLLDEDRAELEALRAEGATLSSADLDQLEVLRLREINETYGDVLAARGDHLRHSLRMIRVQKAREVINAEIEQRRAVADVRRRAFEAELNTVFGSFTEDDEIKARNTVYMRIAGMLDSGQTNFFDEFRGWYSLTEADKEERKIQGQPGKEQSPRDELAAAAAQANGIPEADRDAIIAWAEAGGALAEFGVFASIYFPYLGMLGQTDMAEKELEITEQIFIPTILAGTAMIATGIGLVAGFFTIGWGLAMIAAGTGMVTAGVVQINLKQAVVDGRKRERDDLLVNATEAADIESVSRVIEKQTAYEKALGKLEYFTRAPDLQTAKERIIQWGLQHPDDQASGTDVAGNQLYQITEEDLAYLFDSTETGAQFRDSTGGVLTLTADQQADGLDMAALHENAVFKDAFGRRYDPNPDTLLFAKPGPLVAGTYSAGGVEYISIQVTDHDGTDRLAYAPVVADEVTDEEAEKSTLSLGDLMDLTTQHGIGLRDIRRDRYFAAGEAALATGDADQSLVLKDRDAVFAELFADATNRENGGREYSGYRLVYEEYQHNQREVLERELTQRRMLQTAEWDLRQQEMVDRRMLWERKMETLLNAGTEHWGRVNDNYLQEWRGWERTHDRKVKEGKAKWEERVLEHYAARTEWENEVRRTAAEKTAEAVLTEAVQNLNTQIRLVESNLGMDLEELSATSEVTSMIDEIRRSQPGQTEQLQRINDGVAAFRTRIDLSMITGANTGVGVQGASSNFREEARLHKRQMKTLANVKAAEQYRRMLDLFEQQIEVQNQQIADSTRSAAMGAGFRDEGAFFIKTAGISGAQGAVNRYAWFDTKTAIRDELETAGFALLEGAELGNHLESKSDFEIDLYFETQRQATRTVFDRIIGSDPGERQTSRDVAVIGLFGNWVGTSKVDGTDDVDAVEGFGELGSAGPRASGASMGFFPQLQQASEDLAAADEQHLADLQGPAWFQAVTGIVNGINPLMMLGNTFHNVEVAVINGADRAKVSGANALNFFKQMGTAVGAALLSMTGVGAGLAAGIMLTVASNMINVNPLTGDIDFVGDTPQAWINSAIAIVGARLGVGASRGMGNLGRYAGPGSTRLSQLGSSLHRAGSSLNQRLGNGRFAGFIRSGAGAVGRATSPDAFAAGFTGFVSSGLQGGMRYDGEGNVLGFSVENAVAAGTVGAAAGIGIKAFGGGGLKPGSGFLSHYKSGHLQFGISQTAVGLGEITKYYGGGEWGRDNANIDMFGGDIGVMGSLFGGAVGTRMQEFRRLSPASRLKKGPLHGEGRSKAEVAAEMGVSLEVYERLLHIGGPRRPAAADDGAEVPAPRRNSTEVAENSLEPFGPRNRPGSENQDVDIDSLVGQNSRRSVTDSETGSIAMDGGPENTGFFGILKDAYDTATVAVQGYDSGWNPFYRPGVNDGPENIRQVANQDSENGIGQGGPEDAPLPQYGPEIRPRTDAVRRPPAPDAGNSPGWIQRFRGSRFAGRFGMGYRDSYQPIQGDIAVDWSDELIRVGQGFGGAQEDEDGYRAGIAGYYRAGGSQVRPNENFGGFGGGFSDFLHRYHEQLKDKLGDDWQLPAPR